jgi:hypothetical protein
MTNSTTPAPDPGGPPLDWATRLGAAAMVLARAAGELDLAPDVAAIVTAAIDDLDRATLAVVAARSDAEADA